MQRGKRGNSPLLSEKVPTTSERERETAGRKLRVIKEKGGMKVGLSTNHLLTGGHKMANDRRGRKESG